MHEALRTMVRELVGEGSQPRAVVINSESIKIKDVGVERASIASKRVNRSYLCEGMLLPHRSYWLNLRPSQRKILQAQTGELGANGPR